MLWGIPGALLGAFLALRLGAGLLWCLGLAALVLGAFLLVRGKAVYALPLFLGLLLLRGAVLPYARVMPGRYEVAGTVVDTPERERGRTVAVLSRVSLDGRRVRGTLELAVPYDAALAYGDGLTLEADVVPDERGAVRSLAAVLYSAETAGEITVRRGQADPLYGLALRWQEKLSQSADALFGDNAGIARGMLFGDRDDVRYLTYLAYRRSGLLHLLTVSGLHVGVVCGAALELIRGRRKWLRFLFSVLVLGLFCLLTGLSPSSLRAAVMLLIARFSRLLDRQDDPLSEIGCALSLLLLADPAFLNASGFRLSFGAVWGIACLNGPVRDLLHSEKGGLGDLLAAAVGAFMGMLPLLSVSGGEISWAGPFVSLLALPAAPLFLIPGWAAVLLYPLFPGISRLLALLPQGALYYLDALAELTPVEGVLLPPANGAALVLWFAGLLFLSEFFLPNRKRPAWVGWGLMAAAALIWFLA